MNSALPVLRLSEVQAKLRSLDEELGHWAKLTEAENLGLRRHRLQVARLTTVLHQLTAEVRAALNAQPSATTVLASVEAWENQILAAHSIWEVFRAKLVLREDGLFRDILAACDDLLWAFYAPAMARFAPDRKTPPLVYFTSTWSPFAIVRDTSFQNEIRITSSAAGALADDTFLQVLRRLPIPLVSLPWYQGFHLPGALVLAHEAGHIVASDFDLTADIAAALASAQLSNPAIWESWSAEVFADVYGCVMMGPPFVSALMNLLTVAPETVQNEVRSTGKYPTRSLRIEIALSALAHLGHTSSAEQLRGSWEEVYGPMRTMTELLPDVEKVVAALLAGPYKGLALTSLDPFPSGKARNIQTIGEAARDNFPAILRNYSDVRLLFAAAQWVHEHSSGPSAIPAYGRIVSQAVTRGANEFRMRGEPVKHTDLEAGIADARSADEQTGRELFELLFT